MCLTGFAAAAAFSVTSASAADFGGDCCADLEERIAELEATTARKGNRKVSLTITGWVVENITWWDDGSEQNVYQGGPGITLSSNFIITGGAQITNDWSAGYLIQIEVNHNDSLLQSQDVDDAPNPGLPEFANGVYALQTFWFLQSKTYGKLSLGKQSSATDNITIVGVDGSGTIWPANSPNFGDFQGFSMKRNGVVLVPGAGGTFGNNVGFCAATGAGISMDCAAAAPNNNVRYDTPSFGGFTASASWGEDDFWDIGLRYSGTGGGFKFNAAAGFAQIRDDGFIVPTVALGTLGRNVDYWQFGAYVEHIETGLFLYGTYGHEDINTLVGYTNAANGFTHDDNNAWYLKGGIRAKWNSLGHTVPFVAWQQSEDMLSPIAIAAGATGSSLTRISVGVSQEIDAASMNLWLVYKHFDAEISGPAATCATLCGDIDDFQRVEFGGWIGF